MVLTDEYSFNPDTQKINECITRINDLQPRYQARGFSIEATMQPFIFKYALKVIITSHLLMTLKMNQTNLSIN